LNKIKFFIYCFLFFVITINSLFSQTNHHIITVTGNELIGRVENGESVREVIGNVVMTQGNVVITCDRAIQYLAQNSARLIGNVVAKQDTLTLYTDEGFYYGNEKRAFSDRKIKLDDKKVILTAQVGEYFFDDNLADFKINVKLYDTATTLTSNRLLYYRNENKAIATSNVKIKNSENEIYSDSLIHLRDKKISYAFKNVAIRNYENNVQIFGEHLEDYQERKYTLIDVNPMLMQIDSTINTVQDSITGETKNNISIDTLIMKSNMMESYRDSSERYFAYDSVEIVRGEFSSRNDFSQYLKNSETIITYKVNDEAPKPILWYENTQLSGDSIFIYLKDNVVNKVFVNRNALIVSYNDSFPNRYDQIYGDSLIMYFEDGDLNKAEIYGNVLSIYYLYEDNEPNGLIKSSSVNAIIIFEEKKINEVKLDGEPKSEYHPEKLILERPRDYFLPKFIYYDNKPNKDILLTKIKKFLK
jgi:lipopolysaccharide export system protein LptA